MPYIAGANLIVSGLKCEVVHDYRTLSVSDIKTAPDGVVSFDVFNSFVGILGLI